MEYIQCLPEKLFVGRDIMHSRCCAPIHGVGGWICYFCPTQFWQVFLVHHCFCHLQYVPTFPFGYYVLLRCVSTGKFSSNSFLSEISCKFVREVLLSSVRSKASDMLICCFFDFIFKCLELSENFALLSDGLDPSVPGEVVDERRVISASAKCSHLRWCPYVGADYIQDFFPHIPLLREWMSAFLAESASFTNSIAFFFREG